MSTTQIDINSTKAQVDLAKLITKVRDLELQNKKTAKSLTTLTAAYDKQTKSTSSFSFSIAKINTHLGAFSAKLTTSAKSVTTLYSGVTKAAVAITSASNATA